MTPQARAKENRQALSTVNRLRCRPMGATVVVSLPVLWYPGLNDSPADVSSGPRAEGTIQFRRRNLYMSTREANGNRAHILNESH